MTDAFVCYVRESNRRVNRIGIVTGKKVGNAVRRNRARRVIREAFRLFEPLLKEKSRKRYDFIFVARVKTPTVKSTAIYRQLLKRVMPKITPTTDEPKKQ